MIGGYTVWYLLAASVMFFEAEILTTWFFTRVLVIPRKALYWAMMLALTLATPLLRAGMPSSVTLVLNFALLAVPLVMSRDSVGRRFAIVAFTTVFNVLGDIVLMLIWGILIGGDQTNIGYVGEHPVEFGFMTFARFCATLPFLIAAARIIDKHFPRKDLDENARPEPVFSLMLFVWFPFLQMFLLTTAFFVIACQCNCDVVLLLCTAIVAFACAGVDIVLIRTFSRASRTRQEQMLTEQLEKQLAEYLASYERTMQQVESTARLRHDLRNQVQIVSELANRGEFDRAKVYLRSMIDEVQSVSALIDDEQGSAGAGAGDDPASVVG